MISFDTVISHIFFYHKITLPTRFSTYNGSLIDTFFCKLSKSTIYTIPGIFNKQIIRSPAIFHLSKYYFLWGSPPKYIKVTTQSYEAISNFANEIINADILERLNKRSNADPNTNYNILHDSIERAKDAHLPDRKRYFKVNKAPRRNV